MRTISDYIDERNAKSKASADAGLSGLLKVLGGGLSGFVTGGPVGALIGAGTGLLSAATQGVNIPVKDITSALQKFEAWSQIQYGDNSGGWTNFNWTPGG